MEYDIDVQFESFDPMLFTADQKKRWTAKRIEKGIAKLCSEYMVKKMSVTVTAKTAGKKGAA